ncbi:caspase, EACC1-associated type [Egbenema bharatensis]|uniref:caspase, EACC1-associated type n=1 Tax=Egbenema bharatensis TaxID=3463334 RepID=UPI003A8A0DC0
MGKYALLIGVDTYGEGLQPLPAAPKDVAALREVLLNPEMGGFDEAKPLINPTQPEMAREIELWFQERHPEDLVLLFFSGHGVKDDRRDLYFAATNTEKQRDRLVRSTAIPARFLHDCIGGCKAKYQVLILDCCFSGAFGDLVGKDDGEIPLKEQLGAEGRVILTSTSAVDYSFEEKGADLSIYTRYLVEGIASGAADEDGDGVITAEDLHRYAGRKVEETSPAMSPKIFIPQGQGYRIRLARSPQDDPKLKYRKEAECRATATEFTIPAKRLLIRLRAELGLSDAEAEAIEAEVLKPHREYQRKRQEYQETLDQCLERETPLSQRTIQDLRDYRAHLRLKPEDVATIERSALNGQDLEGYITDLERQQHAEAQRIEQERAEAERRQRELKLRMERQRQAAAQRIQQVQAEVERQHQEAEAERKRQAETQRQREEAERQKPAAANQPKLPTTPPQPAYPRPTATTWTRQKFLKVGIPLGIGVIGVSVIGVLSQNEASPPDYSTLESLLQANDWRGADDETRQLVLQIANRQQKGWLDEASLENFPCEDLQWLDDLWVQHSDGKFGFSVQARIWQEVGSPTEYNEEWEEFGDRVGWRKDGQWLSYDSLAADLDLSPAGEFPGGDWLGGCGLGGGLGAVRCGWGGGSSLVLRLVNCSRQVLQSDPKELFQTPSPREVRWFGDPLPGPGNFGF